MSTKQSIFWKLMLFLAGILVGVIGSNAFWLYKDLQQPGEEPWSVSGLLMNRLKKEVALSAPQQKELAPIIDELRETIDAFAGEPPAPKQNVAGDQPEVTTTVTTRAVDPELREKLNVLKQQAKSNP